MRTSVIEALTLSIALGVSAGTARPVSGQVPTRASEPRLAVPRAEPTATAQPPTPPDTTPTAPSGNAPLNQVTGGGGVTKLGTGAQPTDTGAQATSSGAQAVIGVAARSYVTSKVYLELGQGGVSKGTYVHSIEGGDPVADLVEHASAVGPPNIAVANVKLSDVVAEVGPSDFNDVIGDFFSGKPVYISGHFVGVDINYQPKFQRGFKNALVTEVAFPAMGGASREANYLKIRLTPESVQDEQAIAPPKSLPNLKQKQWPRNGFSFRVSGLEQETARVMAIEPFSISRKMATDNVGDVKVATNVVTRSSNGHLIITFPAADAGGWMAWRDDFLIKGNHTQANEKTLVLTLFGTDQKPLLVLNGTGVGLITLRRMPTTGTDEMAKYQAELYVKQWSLEKGSSKGS